MAMRVNNCCCCNLKTGVFIYAVIYAFIYGACFIVALFTSGEYYDRRYFSGRNEVIPNGNVNIVTSLLGFAKAVLLLYGVIKESSKTVLAYVAIQVLLLVLEVIAVIILSIFMPLLALLFIFIAIEAFLLVFVYSYYRQLAEEKPANVEPEVAIHNKI